jgi:type I restriction-modification system DNA methylase subunit
VLILKFQIGKFCQTPCTDIKNFLQTNSLQMAKSNNKSTQGNDPPDLGFEAKLWLAADKLRNHMDAAEYKQNSAKQPTIGKIVDDAVVAIERDNPRIKDVLPKDYARPGLDRHRPLLFARVFRRARLLQSATTAEIAAHGYLLTRGRYVDAKEVEDDGELFTKR